MQCEPRPRKSASYGDTYAGADLNAFSKLNGLPTSSYGIDSSLTVAKGWDNVTGFGTPQGLPFLEAVAKAAKVK